MTQTFRYIDLFAGIGGFHAALDAFGGECVYAVEIDEAAAKVYERNWGHSPLGDITKDANDDTMNVPPHDVLVAGFPCQPFSKGGKQLGMDETRGTLFWNIMKIVQAHHPTVIMLENVRNLAGPKHKHEWDIIIASLRNEGYRVSSTPAVLSPAMLPRERGGRPQSRERVFIGATYVGKEAALRDANVEPALPPASWLRDPHEDWDLRADLPLDAERHIPGTELTTTEVRWIDAWDEFTRLITPLAGRLPGFPVWVDAWIHANDLNIPASTPKWKANFLRKNAEFYTAYAPILDTWLERYNVASFPESRRKLEWQAQDAARLWDCVLSLRPSGIRAKRLTHLPTLVAITQTPIIGPLRRRLSTREAARLQGLPDTFDFGYQQDAATYRQLGNGVNVGAVWNMLRALAYRDATILESTEVGRAILDTILIEADVSPDGVLQEAAPHSLARSTS